MFEWNLFWFWVDFFLTLAGLIVVCFVLSWLDGLTRPKVCNHKCLTCEQEGFAKQAEKYPYQVCPRCGGNLQKSGTITSNVSKKKIQIYTCIHCDFRRT